MKSQGGSGHAKKNLDTEEEGGGNLARVVGSIGHQDAPLRVTFGRSFWEVVTTLGLGGSDRRVSGRCFVLRLMHCLLLLLPLSTSAQFGGTPLWLVGDLVDGRVIMEIDNASSCSVSSDEPARVEETISALVPGATISFQVGERIPEVDLPQEWNESTIARLAQDYADPFNHAAREPTKDIGSYIYVLIVEDFPQGGLLVGGSVQRWVLERDGIPVPVQGFVVNCRAIKKAARTKKMRERLLGHVVLHEFGHLLGLVGNPSHESRQAPLHCRKTRCIMTTATPWSVVRGFFASIVGSRYPSRFCRECRRDLETALLAVARKRHSREEQVLQSEPPDDLGREEGRRYALVAWGLKSSKNAEIVLGEIGEQLARTSDVALRTWYARLLLVSGRRSEGIALLQASLVDSHDGTLTLGYLDDLRALARAQDFRFVLDHLPDSDSDREFTDIDRSLVELMVWCLHGLGKTNEAFSVLNAIFENEEVHYVHKWILLDVVVDMAISSTTPEWIESSLRQIQTRRPDRGTDERIEVSTRVARAWKYRLEGKPLLVARELDGASALLNSRAFRVRDTYEDLRKRSYAIEIALLREERTKAVELLEGLAEWKSWDASLQAGARLIASRGFARLGLFSRARDEFVAASRNVPDVVRGLLDDPCVSSAYTDMRQMEGMCKPLKEISQKGDTK